jgi:hypothetical protein
MAMPLLTTKLYIPPPLPNLVERLSIPGYAVTEQGKG